MIFADGFAGLLMLGLWIFSFIDVVVTPEAQCRNLPKLAWVFIVLLLPPVGPIGWLVAGHPWDRSGTPTQRVRGGSRLAQRERDRPSRYVPNNPDDDEEFLAGLRKRAEEQRQRARDQQDNDHLDGDKG